MGANMMIMPMIMMLIMMIGMGIVEVEGRIREEELISITTNQATITWVTLLPAQSEVIYGECDSSDWLVAELKIASSEWDSVWKSLINSDANTLDRFNKKINALPNTLTSEQIQDEVESFVIENHAWFARHLTDKKHAQSDEPDLKGDAKLGNYLLNHGGKIVGSDSVLTQYHYVTLDNLVPGVTYCYQVKDGEDFGRATRWSPGYFTTLTPPSGEKLFTFATLNDMHVGEQVAGLVVIGGIVLTPGFEWEDPDNPYWLFTNTAAVNGINQLNVDFTIAKGDISSDFKEQEYIDVKAILDGLTNPYYVMRGNHDRVESGPDYYKLVFNLTSTWYSFDHKGFHFLCLDSVNIANGSPEISDEEFLFLEKDLQVNNNTKTFVFLHHAATWEAFVYSLIVEDRIRFLEILARSPQVVGVFSGHSHRAALTNDRDLPEMIFAETPSAKEYPMGYTVYEVYQGGYIQHFHRSNCVECLEWNSMTRQQYFRMAPFLQYGALSERSFVVHF